MKIRYIVLLLALLPLLAIPVVAHPGKTDSSGGHTDHETGSYHYHHGYPAHQHYDQNGDGKPDCPYEFDDKTNNDSNKTPSNSEISKPSNNAQSNTAQNSTSTVTAKPAWSNYSLASAFFAPSNSFWFVFFGCGIFFFSLVFVRKLEIRFSSGASYTAFLVIMDLEILALAFFTSCFYMPGVGFDSSLIAQAAVWKILQTAFSLCVAVFAVWLLLTLLSFFAFTDTENCPDALDVLQKHVCYFSLISYIYLLLASILGLISADSFHSWRV